MKRTKQCPKCGSLDIGYLEQQVDANDVVLSTGGEGIEPGTPLARSPLEAPPRSVGVSKERVDTGFFTGYGWVSVFVGVLEAYVCTACGYHETYVRSPETVQWEKLTGFQWVNAKPDKTGPYR